ncbi:hypothetical protein Q0601_12095 [Paracoccus onubensis]|uniref:hypothetical protein n=1 Tax=Paracoccus onubensis TaxID=1675788 RepID=UPI00272F5DD7|nr:hypothetical protein [Paracoccus onubensis]MDP0927917.1 hypothetical protein [Paracoccus onubensis]
MNLHLHGTVDVEAGNALCDCGLAFPKRFSDVNTQGQFLGFDAITLELGAYVEIGRIEQTRAARHRFVTEAFARMAVDQYATAEIVVFEHSYLEKLLPDWLEAAHERSARLWRIPLSTSVSTKP